jgi:hypothetical protein
VDLHTIADLVTIAVGVGVFFGFLVHWGELKQLNRLIVRMLNDHENRIRRKEGLEPLLEPLLVMKD